MAIKNNTFKDNIGEVTREEVLEESELGYHNFIIKEAEKANSAMQSWSNFLSAKYKLQQGDSISMDGKIIRKTK